MDNPPDDSYERRREQVRRAQRTHRERKANYVKNLEDETGRLRRQNAELQTLILCYQQLLAQNGIPDTCIGGDPQPPPERLATINFIRDPTRDTQGIQVTLPSANPGTSSSSSTNIAGGLPPPSSVAFPTPQNTDATQMAINFILALERPCLVHHYNYETPEFSTESGHGGATGHDLMLSSPIMAHLPERFAHQAAEGSGGHAGYLPPTDAQWTMPTAEIETLLQCSQDLGLDEAEITPVQAWHILTQNPKFVLLSVETLEVLKQELIPLVRCRGFGAIMDRNDFEEAVERVFASVGR